MGVLKNLLCVWILFQNASSELWFRFFSLKRKTKVICCKIQKFTQQECSAPSNIPPSPFSFYKQVTRFFLCLQFQTGSSFVYGSWHFPRFSEAAILFYSLMSPFPNWFLFCIRQLAFSPVLRSCHSLLLFDVSMALICSQQCPSPPPLLFCHGCPALGHTFITCGPLPLFLTVHVDPLL